MMKTSIFAFYSGCLFIALFFTSSSTCKAQCTPDFSFDVNDSSNTVRFTNLSEALPNTSYYWRFGDSTVSAEKDPLHVYSQKGIFNVCMSLIDSACNNTVCKTVQVRPDSCALNFTYTIGPEPWTVNCYNNSAGTVDAFTWLWGDVTASKGQRDAIHSYSFQAHFNVCLVREETGLNCPGTICKVVKIPADSCHTDFTTSINQETNTVRFYNSSFWFANTDFTWHFGDGDSSIESSPLHIYSSLGTHQVCLIKRNAACTQSVCKTIMLDGRYPCSASFSQEQDSLNHKLIWFKNLSKGRDLSYQWHVSPGGMSDTTTDFSYVFPHDGYFDVCLNIQEADSFCHSSICTKVLIYSDTAGCHAKFIYQTATDSITHTTKVIFLNQSPGNHKISSWDFGDHNISNRWSPEHAYSGKGLFTVCLAVYDTLIHCSDTSCSVIRIFPDTNTGVYSNFPDLQEVKLYPVPFEDKLNIEFAASYDQLITIRITNIVGALENQEIRNVRNGNNRIEVNMNKLGRGVYFVELITDKGNVLRKVLK